MSTIRKIEGWVDGILTTRETKDIASVHLFAHKRVPDLVRATVIIGGKGYTEADVKAISEKAVDAYRNSSAMPSEFMRDLPYNQGQQDRWISVEDRLPEKGVTVIVLGPTEDGDGIGLDALDPDSDGDTWIEWSNAHEQYVICGIPESVGPSEEANYTHWSPIPSPPNPEQR